MAIEKPAHPPWTHVARKLGPDRQPHVVEHDEHRRRGPDSVQPVNPTTCIRQHRANVHAVGRCHYEANVARGTFVSVAPGTSGGAKGSPPIKARRRLTSSSGADGLMRGPAARESSVSSSSASSVSSKATCSHPSSANRCAVASWCSLRCSPSAARRGMTTRGLPNSARSGSCPFRRVPRSHLLRASALCTPQERRTERARYAGGRCCWDRSGRRCLAPVPSSPTGRQQR